MFSLCVAKTSSIAVIALAIGVISIPACADPSPDFSNGQKGPSRPIFPPHPHHPIHDLVVETDEGLVEGFKSKGITEFLGIPYAAAPVGDLRWRPTIAHAPWGGILKTTSFGPSCAQITTLGVFAGPPNNNEDCLYLNVFTPNLEPNGKKLPVIFWIYGGGNFDGESNDYDASKLAAQGHTVVVTINYRLGLLGFLGHPALDHEGHLFGNYGILDQQFALQWVKNNIERFGGDKNNVTVGGQSAGANDTSDHVLSPLSAGLFNRAIYQSGGGTPLIPLSVAESRGTAFATAAGCGSGSTPAVAQCLRNLPVGQVMTLSGTASGTASYFTNNGTIGDGQILPVSAIAAYQNGHFNHVPVMDGVVQDEGNFFIGITEYFSGPPRKAVTADDYTNYVTAVYSGFAGPGTSAPNFPAGTVEKVLAQYPLNSYPTPQLAQDAVETDPTACRQRKIEQILAPQTPVYAYEFRDRTAPFYFPQMPGFVPLAAHTIDIQYLFPLWHGGPDGIPHELNETQERLSDQLVGAWTNFARSGNPNAFGNYPWPRYEGKQGYMLAEKTPSLSTFTDAEFNAEHKCDFWESILLY